MPSPHRNEFCFDLKEDFISFSKTKWWRLNQLENEKYHLENEKRRKEMSEVHTEETIGWSRSAICFMKMLVEAPRKSADGVDNEIQEMCPTNIFCAKIKSMSCVSKKQSTHCLPFKNYTVKNSFNHSKVLSISNLWCKILETVNFYPK